MTIRIGDGRLISLNSPRTPRECPEKCNWMDFAMCLISTGREDHSGEISSYFAKLIFSFGDSPLRELEYDHRKMPMRKWMGFSASLPPKNLIGPSEVTPNSHWSMGRVGQLIPQPSTIVVPMVTPKLPVNSNRRLSSVFGHTCSMVKAISKDFILARDDLRTQSFLKSNVQFHL